MDSIAFFEKHIKAKIPEGYSLAYFDYKNGDFGDLHRVGFESESKIGEFEFWSMGWVGVCIVDLNIGDQVLNVLMRPEEEIEIKKNLEKALAIMCE